MNGGYVLNVIIEQAQKRKSVFDMMVSMHFKLRDDYNKWNVFFDSLELLIAIFLCGITFLSFPNNLRYFIGIASILFLALTFIKQRLNLKKKAEQHNIAGKLYLSAKLDLEQHICVWKENDVKQEEIISYMKDKYRELTEVVSIPENRFHKLKHHHYYKVEFSKFIDKNKTSPWIVCKLKFTFCRSKDLNN